MNLNFSPPFPMEQINDDEHDQQHQLQALNFGLNQQIVSSPLSSSASCHIFFNTTTQDHAGFYHPQLYQPHHLHPDEDDYYNAYHGRSFDQNKVENGVKLSLWKKGDEAQISSDDRVKWMASKMNKGSTTQNISAAMIEAKKVKPSSSVETDDLNSNSSSYNCNTPIRVCSDCHTTKTPLWRSGPKGPKSLCNACGIRQRKARRAMAAAAAENGGGVACEPPRAVKMKVKEKMGLKKRCKVASGGSSANSGKKINGLEDFLINLSNKLAFHRMFPQDEKEAAILLMALSSGRVYG